MLRDSGINLSEKSSGCPAGGHTLRVICIEMELVVVHSLRITCGGSCGGTLTVRMGVGVDVGDSSPFGES